MTKTESKGIIENSMKILAFIYKKDRTDSNEIIEQSGLDKRMIFKCIKFLYSSRI